MSGVSSRPVVHCEWGPAGLHAQSEESDLFVIVDVLSLGTTVVMAMARGAAV